MVEINQTASTIGITKHKLLESDRIPYPLACRIAWTFFQNARLRDLEINGGEEVERGAE